MHGMDFHAVHARLLQQQRGARKGVDEFLDLRNTQSAAWHLVGPAVGRRACGSGDLVEIHDRFGHVSQYRIGVHLLHGFRDREGTAEARRQLHEQLRAGGVEFRHPLRQIVIHLMVCIKPLAEHRIVDRLAARQHQAGVVLRRFQNEIGARFVKVVALHPAEQIRAAHRCQHNAVLDLTAADLPRRKQCIQFFFHDPVLLADMSCGIPASILAEGNRCGRLICATIFSASRKDVILHDSDERTAGNAGRQRR